MQFPPVIQSLDLSDIRKRLERIEKRFTDTQVLRMENEYRKFLTLLYLYPNEELVPSPEADIFWHQHILSTRKYQDDCLRVFGSFLHHTPESLESDAFCADAEDAWKRSAFLYEREFGAPYSPYCETLVGAVSQGKCTGARCRSCRSHIDVESTR